MPVASRDVVANSETTGRIHDLGAVHGDVWAKAEAHTPVDGFSTGNQALCASPVAIVTCLHRTSALTGGGTSYRTRLCSLPWFLLLSRLAGGDVLGH